MAVTINGKPRITTTGDILAKGGITAGTLNDTPISAEIVATSSGQSRVAAESPAGYFSLFSLRTDQEERWQIVKSNDAESGGNAGSHFRINRNNDDGNYLDTPFEIHRHTGEIHLNRSSESANTLTINSTYAQVYLRVKSTDGSTPNPKLYLSDSTTDVGEFAIWSSDLYHVNNVSGKAHIFQVHDTTGLKNVVSIYATSAMRYFRVGDNTVTSEIWIDAGGSTLTAGLVLRSSDKHRWQIQHNNTAESGSNAGSDFAIHAYNDAGTWLSQPFIIERATGNAQFRHSSSPGYLDVLSTNASEDSRIRFLDNVGAYRGQFAQISDDNIYISNNLSGKYIYFQTHNTSSLKVNAILYSTATVQTLQLGDGTLEPQFKINGAASTYRGTIMLTNGTMRWWIAANSTAESGSNAGSDLNFYAYSDAGALLSSPLAIVRSSGNMYITNEFTQQTSSGANTLLEIKNSNTTTSAGIQFRDSEDVKARISISGGGGGAASAFYIGNYISGGGTYLQVHDTTGVKDMMYIVATNTYRRFDLGDGTLDTYVRIDGGAGKDRWIEYQSNGSPRWRVTTNSTAESGSNVGSDFIIYRYSDAGGYLGDPFVITRSTGTIYLGGGGTVSQIVCGSATATTSQLFISSDSSAGSELIYVDEGQVSANWYVNNQNNLQWGRYYPAGTYQGVGLTLASSDGSIYLYNDAYIGKGLTVGNTSTSPGDNNLLVDGDIFTIDDYDYFSSSTKTGWSSPTGNIICKKVGDTCFIWYYITGTANTTAASFSIPWGPIIINYSVGRGYHNGAYTTCYATVGAGAGPTTVVTSPLASGGGWWDSGTKTIYGTIVFQDYNG